MVYMQKKTMLECHCANTERGNFGEKSSLTVEFICVLAFCVFVKKSFPQDILKHQETPELGVLLRKTSLLG